MQNKQPKKANKPFQLLNPDAAGIDIGGAFHFVAVPEGRDDKPGCFGLPMASTIKRNAVKRSLRFDR